MEFFRKNEQDDFQKGDVIRFENKDAGEYHYAIISELPSGIFHDENDGCEKYAAIILNDYGCLHAGDTYRTAKNIHKLIDVLSDSEIGWEIVEKAKTRTEDLMD